MIKCDIIHVSLEELPQYVAISYAWRDLGDTRKIDIGGNSIPISVSLHGALQALRQKKKRTRAGVGGCFVHRPREQR